MVFTLTHALDKVVKEFPHKVCIKYRQEGASSKYTYQEIYNSALGVTAWLKKLGVKKGERIALCLENCPQWTIAYFGIVFCGAIAVPIDNQSSFEELEYILKDSKAKVIFTSGRLIYLKKLKNLDYLKKIVVIEGEDSSEKTISFSKIISSKPNLEPITKIQPEDLASIIYTSGTTGFPKGVMLTHKNFFANFLSIKKLNFLNPQDNILAILPLHHVYAFLVTLITPLLLGAKVIYIEGLKIEEIFKALNKEKISVMVVVPQILYLFYRQIKEKMEASPFIVKSLVGSLSNFLWILRRLIKINLSKVLFRRIHSYFGGFLRFFISGGAKLDKEVATFFFKLGFNVFEGYGLTETSPVVTFNLPWAYKIGSVGRAVPGVDIKICQADNSAVGEVVISGPNVMRGYYQNDKETKEVLKGKWFYTGDLGYIDKKGYLFIEGRLKEIIVLSSGKNVSPQEVENHYLKRAFIEEICVLADDTMSILGAVIVPNYEHLKKVKESKVYDVIKWNLEYSSQSLPSYKRIRNFVLTNESLPRTRLGKIQRFKVAQIFKDKIKEKSSSLSELNQKEDVSYPWADKVLNILKKSKNLEKISLGDHLELDLGIDSLDRLELMLALEKSLNIKIKEDDLSGVFTVSELFRVIERLLPKEDIAVVEEHSVLWKDILDLPLSLNLRSKIDLSVRLVSKLFTFSGAIFLNLLFRIFFRLKVNKKCNLANERFIICPNHSSYLDGFIIFAAMPLALKYNLFFIGLSSYFEIPIVRNLIRTLRVIPVDYSSNVVESMKAARLVLGSRKILCIFPEGSRSVDGQIKDFKKGIGILAKELDVKIVPVYIKGAHQSWKPTSLLPRFYPLEITFGKPRSPGELQDKGLRVNKDADDYSAISLGVREEVIKLQKST